LGQYNIPSGRSFQDKRIKEVGRIRHVVPPSDGFERLFDTGIQGYRDTGTGIQGYRDTGKKNN